MLAIFTLHLGIHFELQYTYLDTANQFHDLYIASDKNRTIV